MSFYAFNCLQRFAGIFSCGLKRIKLKKIEQMKLEEQNLDNTRNPQLNIPAVSGSADRYTEKLDKDWDDDIYTIEEWKDAVNNGWITNYDGSGYWVKDGLKSRDEVFSTPQLDATHVVWYNK